MLVRNIVLQQVNYIYDLPQKGLYVSSGSPELTFGNLKVKGDVRISGCLWSKEHAERIFGSEIIEALEIIQGKI